MKPRVFDPRICALGEGPFWHPEREQLFWFDILGQKLMSRVGSDAFEWVFEESVSAAGWVDRETLLIASETALLTFDIASGEHARLVPLEETNTVTRSNDGRADPFGGFWIGSMGKNSERGAGSIHRYYKGVVECLVSDLTVANAICFSPEGDAAYFTDTWSRIIMKQDLDAEGWPKGPAVPFIDMTAERLNPDGAVVDAQGCLWNAQWGAGRVSRYSPEGTLMETLEFPATQTSCPAFGGTDLSTLYVTSAAVDMPADDTSAGQTFVFDTSVKGQREHRVIL